MLSPIRRVSSLDFLSLFSSPSHAVETPRVSVSGTRLSWPAIDAIAINVYHATGELLESIPGNATSWEAPGQGRYFLAGANHGDPQTWVKSDIVQVLADDPEALPVS